jgi:hypothetical protein
MKQQLSEKQILQSILQPVPTNSPRRSFFRREIVPMAQVVGVVVIFLALFRFTDSIGLFGVVIIATCLGFASGIFFYRYLVAQQFLQQWPVIRPYVDSDAVQARLDQLEQ